MPTNGTTEVISVLKSNSVEFVQFFKALWDKEPFAWQKELADRVSGNAAPLAEWPEAIALPTASGKTACVDIAVFALANQASRMARGEVITAPRRIFFVVDRRVIVDQAYERARVIAKKLCEAEDRSPQDVADSLRQIASARHPDLNARRRCGHTHCEAACFVRKRGRATLSQPTVVASTVDQVGSRLLFRAYGRGSGTWPVYGRADCQRQPDTPG